MRPIAFRRRRHRSAFLVPEGELYVPAPVLGPSIGPQGVTVGNDAFGVAVNPLTNRVYVTNIGDGTVSVISGLGERGSPQSRPVIATIRVGSSPARVAVNPLTHTAYVTNSGSGSVSVIDLRTNKVTTTAGSAVAQTGLRSTLSPTASTSPTAPAAP